LAKWGQIGEFPSEQDCTDYKAAELKQVTDPAWLSAQAAKAHHLVDAQRAHDLIESGRCVNASQL
jgi:hypothetical protein